MADCSDGSEPMNFKTTLALLVLVGVGLALLWYGQLPPALDPAPQPVATSDQGSREVLNGFRPDRLTRIAVHSPGGVTELRRKPDGSWGLPGNWPVRTAEVQALVDLLAGLRSRFEAIP